MAVGDRPLPHGRQILLQGRPTLEAPTEREFTMSDSVLLSSIKGAIPRRLHPAEFAKRKVAEIAQGKVLAGPFKGMQSITSPADFVDYTMLLGTYELELRPFVEEIRNSQFRTIIEVGAAQGYYAVGFAMICPDSQIIAFESNPEASAQLVRTARANRVEDRIRLEAECGPEILRKVLDDPGSSLVFMDIDGGERDLLDPEQVPELKYASVLLEEHECFVPGIIALIENRFQPTHAIERVQQEVRSVDDLCVRSPLLDRWLVKLMHERPPGNSWIYMRPRARCPRLDDLGGEQKLKLDSLRRSRRRRGCVLDLAGALAAPRDQVDDARPVTLLVLLQCRDPRREAAVNLLLRNR